MQRPTRYVLGVLVVVMVSSAVSPTASAQGAKPDACQYMDAAQMLQLTGRKDDQGKGPQKQDPSEIPNHTSGNGDAPGPTLTGRPNASAAS